MILLVIKKVLLFPLAALLSVSLFACAPASETPTVDTPTTEETPVTEETPTVKTFTLEELAMYNGKDGNPAYVAINGIVYDVTNVPEWMNGMHQNGLTAGQDLSDYINTAPHGTTVLQSLPVVGELAE